VAVRTVPEGRLVYGMQLPIQAQSTVFVDEWERTAGPDDLARIARQADQAGFFYVAVCDHVVIPRRLAPAMGTTWYDTIATLGFLAGITTTVRLMSHVWVAAFRHPLLSAKAFSTLDHLSGGRVIVGVGAGHVPEEFASLGVDFHQRGRLLDEAIDALKAALSQEFPVFSGPTWETDGGGIGPRPVQQPRPPIWVGGSSPAAIRRAATRGDGWLPQGTPRAKMPEQIAMLLDHRRRVLGEDGAAAEPFDIGTICELLYVGTPGWDVGGRVITGEPQKLAEAIRAFGDMGVDHVQIRFKVRSCDELLDQMARFGAEVGPLLNG
jgi:probable F420-dependent oxidoreductase